MNLSAHRIEHLLWALALLGLALLHLGAVLDSITVDE